MQYTSKPLIENHLKRDLTEAEEAYLFIAVPAIEQYIDRRLSSHFGKVDATTRRYETNGEVVDIDPCTEISSVSLIDTYDTIQYSYVPNYEYHAYPLNTPVKNELVNHGCWPNARVAVTAQFSEYYNGVPEDIKIVATRLAAGTIASGAMDANGTNISAETIEGHSITYDASPATLQALTTSDPIVMAILDQRKQIMI
jgi:hypothetical protein